MVLLGTPISQSGGRTHSHVTGEHLMPRKARVYIVLVICTGAAVLLLAARSWSPASLAQFLTLLGFAAVSSTLKIRIPRLESSMSPSFVFLLLAMLCSSFSEVVAIALVAA